MLKTEGIKIDVEYLWDGSIGNYEEIMAEANEVSGDFAERLEELIDKTNESADALADFVEAVEDAASSLLEETKYSNTEREIKKLQRENKKDEAIIAANPNSVEAIEA
jgi:cob(I)alamin adenosyltransferase